jgi:hypothetical protein
MTGSTSDDEDNVTGEEVEGEGGTVSIYPLLPNALDANIKAIFGREQYRHDVSIQCNTPSTMDSHQFNLIATAHLICVKTSKRQ